LQEGDVLSVNELLYGLMLPSGNDAAHQLALHFGAKLLQLKSESEAAAQVQQSPSKGKQPKKEQAKDVRPMTQN
jgi:D-alanyl-D-alanine carboxypeptidase